jgi:hypothetical protein
MTKEPTFFVTLQNTIKDENKILRRGTRSNRKFTFAHLG